MKILPRRAASCWAALILIFATTTAFGEDRFTGSWLISDARTLNGRPYSGSVRIASSGGVFEVQWDTTAGKYRGLGLADGDRLCTGWGGKSFGVVLYKIKGDGTLEGRWTIPGANEAEGTEQAVGGSAGELEGDYRVKGSNPGGRGGYEGKLRIRKTGETYQLRWTIPGSRSYSGIGLKVGDSLHVGWGIGGAPYAVISYLMKDGKAEGNWSIGGSSSTAREDLVRK